MKSIAQKLLLKSVGIVDTPSIAADFINTGTNLYKCSRRFRRIGLSGYRSFNKDYANGTATKKMCLMIFFQIRGEVEILQLLSMTGLRSAIVQNQNHVGSTMYPCSLDVQITIHGQLTRILQGHN